MSSQERRNSPNNLQEHDREQPRLLTPLQNHFLRRMERLVQQRNALLASKTPDPLAKKLLARAIYATLLDSMGAGVGDEANAILNDNASVGS